MKHLWKKIALLVVVLFFVGEEQTFAQKKSKPASNQAPRTATPQPSANVQTSPNPKKTSALSPLFTPTMFSDSTFAKQWKKVDSCRERGLPKSALEIVEKILAEAQKTKNLPHIVKALLQKSVLQAETDENGESTFVNEITSAIQGIEKSANAGTPENIVALALLRSALAEYYNLYLQNYRWKIQGRTAIQPLAQDSSADYRAWDTRRFFTTIRSLHFLALSNKAILQRTPLPAVETMLTPGNSAGERLRPTLYDVLAFRALAMLNNTSTSLPTPEEECEIPLEAGLKPIPAFLDHTFATPDTQDWKYQTICLYQDILRFHATDSLPDALLDANRLRLNFVKNYAFGDNMQDAYIQALERDAAAYKQSPIVAEYFAAIGEEYFAKGEYITARAYCAKAFAYPKSLGSEEARGLEERILAKEMTVQTEKTVLPNAPVLVSVVFRNIEKMHFRLVRLPARNNEDENWRDYFYDDDGMKRLLKLKAVCAWSENLPLKDSNGVVDYKLHRVDVRVPIKPDSMPFGRYIVLASSNEFFSTEKNTIAWTNLTATRLALVRDQNVFIVTDAVTGEPQEGVTVRFWQQYYDQSRNKYREKIILEKTTDKNGFCQADVDGSNGATFVELQKGKDILRDGTFAPSYTEPPPQPQEQVRLFTDRALYRPGQTVYFKGIAIYADGVKPDNYTLRGKNYTVHFYDANNRELAKQTFTTNEYGSFQGTFNIPLGVLNGQMVLRAGELYYNQASIRVEEYKRPKFEVKMQKPKELIRVGDVVKAKGTAANYAGSVVDGATVQYRIVRNARFPYWCGAWWMPVPQSPEKEIARGRVKSDAKGEFMIEFTAVPDKSLLPSSLPIFNYTVFADVTDISGETHSASAVVAVGYVATEMRLSAPQRIEKAELKKPSLISIRTSNLNGEALATQGTVRLEKLIVPSRITRNRFLPMPDRYIMSESEFLSAFPHDLYNNKNDREFWNVEKEVLNQSFTTNAQGAYSLAPEQLTSLAAGAYRIRAELVDVSGTKLEQIAYLTVFDSAAKKPALTVNADILPLKTVCEPRETASFLLSTSYPNAKIFYQLEQKSGIAKKSTLTPIREWLSLSDEQRVISIPIPDEFRGNVTAHLFLIHDYRIYQNTVTVRVPWTNKELSIVKSTFRDKTRPGSQEEWTLSVRGEKSSLVSAELVATLYDASLDAILGENNYEFSAWKTRWQPFQWQTFPSQRQIICQTFGASSPEYRDYAWNAYSSYVGRAYADLRFDFLYTVLYGNNQYFRGGVKRSSMRAKTASGTMDMDGAQAEMADYSSAAPQEGRAQMQALSASAPAPPPAPPGAASPIPTKNEPSDKESNAPSRKQETADLSSVKARTNLSETAFFMPQLRTNEKGDVLLKFTMPEALTRWRMLAFAHTPDLKTGTFEAETLTQKELMMLPNMPRFLREGDDITLPVKIANLTSKQIRGTAELKLFDALTMQELPLGFKQQSFTAEAAQSSVVAWSLKVPEGLQAVVYRVVAKASGDNGEFSDGEEAALPVLANKMLVTETLPLNIRGNSTKTFEFKKLAEAQKSSTLRHQRLTLEMTSNPAWYAIQALPMLMEYPYDCTEQLWNRLYANSISTHLANSKPRIKAVFDAWKQSKESLLSNLEKNQELKALLLEETPWVMNANDETERKRRVGLLFDLNRMSGEATNVLQKLQERQLPNGGFTWFPGMMPSRFITQYLVSGIGHLAKLGVLSGKTLPSEVSSGLQNITERAVPFIDQEIADEFRKLKQQRGFKETSEYLSYDAVQYLYARSFFADKPIPSATREAFDFWSAQAAKYWTNQGLMGQSMLALALKRFAVADRLSPNTSKQAVPEQILKSLRERALKSDEMGMYWKQDAGWWWYQAPIETQALAIEAFIEVAGNDGKNDAALKEVEEMKIWLLKQKQTQDWKTTKATAEACYALLLRGADWLESSKIVEVKLGKTVIDQKAIAAQGASIEAGTGYYKVSFGKGEITPDMGTIVVNKSDAGIAWGGVYWQYFEQLNNITPAKTPLQLDKKLYRQNTTAKGLELEPITDKTSLRVGDLVKVRVELRSDREMEYIHLKDMRGAGLEPVAALSGYRWQNGLGYYETMRDASANFFIGWLPRGVWVFEYALRVTHEGTFQNGITTIQSMYAPEFSSHSEGVVVRVQR
ncbi:MAG: hypothetical protein EAZ92_15165 [Candidatus Kapaibacterium sp.]|nr:MAG: hypothetical protein EAZ92_15165 [Candidatus Kapabacteria bacterium]